MVVAMCIKLCNVHFCDKVAFATRTNSVDIENNYCWIVSYNYIQHNLVYFNKHIFCMTHACSIYTMIRLLKVSVLAVKTVNDVLLRNKLIVRFRQQNFI